MKRGRPLTLSEDDLLTAAEAVFLEQGLDATTPEVARRAKISESVIFHRYQTKEALFLAVLERHLKPAPELEGLRALAGEGEIADHLHRVGMLLIERMRTALPFFMLAFCSPMKMNALHARVRQAHPRYVRLLNDYFKAEARAGRLRHVDATILAHTFLGGVREYVFTELFTTSNRRPSATKYLRGMIALLLPGEPAPRRKVNEP